MFSSVGSPTQATGIRGYTPKWREGHETWTENLLTLLREFLKLHET